MSRLEAIALTILAGAPWWLLGVAELVLHALRIPHGH